MKDLMGLMKQAKEMQAKMQEAQGQVADLEATGKSGAGLIEITMSGEGNMKSLRIDPSLMSEETEILEDLIVAAFQDAKVKLDEAKGQAMKSAFGDMQLPPGMKMPF